MAPPCPSRRLRQLTAVASSLLMAGLVLLTAGPAAAAVNSVRLTVISDGSAPFDSLDSGAANGKVRTSDVLTYGWSYSSDTSPSASITFVQTLTAPTSVRFDESNLAQCTAGPGAISTDGKTLTCPVKVDATGSGLVPITVAVPGSLANGQSIGSTLTANAGALDGGTKTVSVAALPQSSISGSVWLDRNGNGIHEVEPDYSDFPVQLAGTDDLGAAVSKSTTTNTDGAYTFPGLRAGSYKVTFPPSALRPDLEFSPQAAGDDRSIDSDGDPTTGVTSTITLGSGVSLTGISQGIRVAAPKVTLTSSAATVDFGSPVTLTAEVSQATATGSVIFFDTFASGPFAGSTVNIGSASIQNRTAVLTTPLQAFGANTITAVYEGDADHPGASSTPVKIESSGAKTSLVVSEFRLSGPSGATDQYVELTNSGSVELPLPGITVRTAAGTTVTLAKTSGWVRPGRTFLIAAAGYSLGQVASPDLNIPTLGASTGGVRVSVPDTAATVTDAVGTTAGFSTGTKLAALSGTPTAPYAWVRLAQTGVAAEHGRQRG